MALNNPFDEIVVAEPTEENPFDLLSKGISEEAPEGINPFDAIGFEPPPPVEAVEFEGAQPGFLEKFTPLGSVQDPEELQRAVAEDIAPTEEPRTVKPDINLSRLSEDEVSGGKLNVQGVDIYREAGTGDLYGIKDGSFASLTPQEEQQIKTSDEWKANKWETVPWVDPLLVGTGATGAATKLALRKAAGLLPALAKGAVTGTIAAGAEFPIGTTTEIIAEDHPGLALPFNVAVGVLSGVTIEAAIERAVIRSLAKGATKTAIKAKTAKITEALQTEDYSDTVTRNVADDINEQLRVATPAKSAEESADILRTAPIAEDIAQPTAKITPEEDVIPLTERVIDEAPTIKPLEEGQVRPNFRQVAEETFPDADGEEITYMATRVAENFEDAAANLKGRKAGVARGTAEAWRRFAETGEDVGTRGGEKSFDFGVSSFEKEMNDYLAFKATKAGDVAAGGLAFGQPLPKYAASINLERVGSNYDTKKMILDTADRYKAQITEARRGKITHETTRKLADDLGMTQTQLLKRRKGRAFNAEESLAARDILNTSADNMVLLQKRIVEDPSEENLALFKMAMERHAAIQAEVSGVATEAGRALSAHRIQSIKNARAGRNFEKMLDIMGGRRNNDNIARAFATIDPEDQAAVNKFVMEMSEATKADKIFEAWINGLLSGPQTHVVNTTSNALTFLSGLPERATGATLDLLRAGITHKPRERFFGEIPEHIYGTWQGMKEGVRAGVKAFATEVPTEDAMKLEIPRQMAIKGQKGRIIRLPGRALMAMDEFFKAINYRSELHSLAFRQAAKEGHKGQKRAVRIADIVQNPSDELKEKATEEMLYRVFQKELGPSGQALTKLRNVTPGLRYIVPFLKTPTNIAKFGLERTPLSVLRYPKMFKQLMKGEIKPEEITDEMAKTIMGSMIGATTFMLAKEGSITGGGPNNRADREALFATGWQPYSIKIGDKYYSYGRLEPLGMVMGISADASDIWDEMNKEEQENVAALIGLSVGKNLTSKTFMKGLSDAMDAATDPGRHGARWVRNFAGTVVPSIAAATTRAIDPELKQAQTIIDKIKSRIPGISEQVLAIRDRWGEPVERALKGPAALVSPVFVSREKGSKADKEIERLGVRIGKTSRNIGDIELTPEQYDKLLAEGGAEAKRRVDRFVNQGSYKNMRDELKARLIKKRYEAAISFTRRRIAREIKHPGVGKSPILREANGGGQKTKATI
ncbi:MAG: hypothetical protein V3U75_01340 [Methylococcaceae bacterium]